MKELEKIFWIQNLHRLYNKERYKAERRSRKIELYNKIMDIVFYVIIVGVPTVIALYFLLVDVILKIR